MLAGLKALNRTNPVEGFVLCAADWYVIGDWQP